MALPPHQAGRTRRKPSRYQTLAYIRSVQKAQAAATAPIRPARQARRQNPNGKAARNMIAYDHRTQEIGKAVDDLLKLRDRLIQYHNFKGVVTWLLRRIGTMNYGLYSPIPGEAAALHCDCDQTGPEVGSAQAWIHLNHTLFNLAAREIVQVERTGVLAAAEDRLAKMDEENENRAQLQALIDYFLCEQSHDWLIGTSNSLGPP